MKKNYNLVLCLLTATVLAGCDNPPVPFDDLKVVNVVEKVKNSITSPAVTIYEIDSKEKLDAYGKNADNLLVNIDKSLNVIDKNGEKISTLSKLQSLNLNTIICPRINDVETAEAFETFVSRNLTNDWDYTVFSSSTDVLTYIKSTDTLKCIRTAYDVSNKQAISIKEERINANKLNAHILVISQNQIDPDEIRRCEALCKTVWVYSNDVTETDDYACICSGASGIITKRINFYNTAINKFEKYNGKIMYKTSFNIAHRGLPTKCPENTVYSCEEAIKGGAEALELDFHVTKDNEIVCMHDVTLNAVIDKEVEEDLYVADMTKAEIQQYRVARSYTGEEFDETQPIPFIEDIAELLYRYPDVILYFEVKSTEERFAEIASKKIKDLNLVDRILIIQFQSLPLSIPHYDNLKELIPELWGADLIWAPLLDESSIIYKCEHNCAYNANVLVSSLLSEDFTHFGKIRGFLPVYWTLLAGRAAQLKVFYDNDVFSMTNNNCDEFGMFVKKVVVNDSIIYKEDIIGKEVNVSLVSYNGVSSDGIGKIISASKDYAIIEVIKDGYTRIVSAKISN